MKYRERARAQVHVQICWDFIEFRATGQMLEVNIHLHEECLDQETPTNLWYSTITKSQQTRRNLHYITSHRNKIQNLFITWSLCINVKRNFGNTHHSIRLSSYNLHQNCVETRSEFLSWLCRTVFKKFQEGLPQNSILSGLFCTAMSHWSLNATGR